MEVIKELTRKREYMMARTEELIKERSKLIFVNRDLMKEHKELKEANNKEYSGILG